MRPARRERRPGRGGRGLRGVSLARCSASSAWRRRPRRARWSRSCAPSRRAPGRGRAGRCPCRPRSRAARTRPLVGRGEPLAALRAAWRRASAGAAAVVMVHGEAGSGKTRLLIELAGEARAGGATVLAGRCTEDGVVAFAPFTEALRPTVAGAPARASRVGASASSPACCPSSSPTAGPPEGEPQDARHRLFEAVAAAIGHAARQAPVLLIVEDLHWADPRDAADARARDPDARRGPRCWSPARCATRTPRAVPALHALLGDLRRERRLERVALAGLSEDEVGDLAGRVAGRDAPSPGLAAAVHRRTGWQPAVRRGARAPPGRVPPRQPGRGAGRAPPAPRCPQGVRSVIDRRLARLPEPAGPGGAAARPWPARTSRSRTSPPPARRATRSLADGARRGGRRPGWWTRRPVPGALPLRPRAGPRGRAGGAERAPAARCCTGGWRRCSRRCPATAGVAGAGAAPPRRPAAGGRRDGRERRPARGRAGDADGWPTRTPRSSSSAPPTAATSTRRPDCARRCCWRWRRAPAAGRRARPPTAASTRRAEHRARARDHELLGARGARRGGADRQRRPRPGRRARAARGGAGRRRRRTPSCGRGCSRGWRSRSTTRRRRRLRERLSDEALRCRAAHRRPGAARGARRAARRAVEPRTTPRSGWPSRTSSSPRRRPRGDREAELQGVNWRVADLFELGDARRAARRDRRPRAPGRRAAPARLRLVRPDVAGHARAAGRSGWRRRSGSRRRARASGAAAHDDNAELLFEVQRNAIDGAAGRMTDEEYDRMRRRAEHSPAGGAWRAALADRGRSSAAMRTARPARSPREVAGTRLRAARRQLAVHGARRSGLLAAHLGDARAAAELYPRPAALRPPHRHGGARVLSAPDRRRSPLGLLAATLGDRPAAVAHLEEAVRRNDALGAVAYAAAARHALAGLRRSRAAVAGRAARGASERAGDAGLTLA